MNLIWIYFKTCFIPQEKWKVPGFPEFINLGTFSMNIVFRGLYIRNQQYLVTEPLSTPLMAQFTNTEHASQGTYCVFLNLNTEPVDLVPNF